MSPTISALSQLMLITMVPLIFLYWQRDRRNQRVFEMEKMEIQLRSQQRLKTDKLEFQSSQPETVFAESNHFEADLRNGYIVVEMEEKKRQVFEDILKGFEDYAGLKGYKIAFSADNSIPGKFVFKFTLLDEGVEVSIEKVKRDIQEFIARIDSGEPLENLPVIIPLEEHQMIMAKLINRINFVNYNYKITESTLNHLQTVMNNMTKMNSPQIYLDVCGNSTNSTKLSNGGNLDMAKYETTNSQGVIQGKGNSHNIIDVSQNKTTIKIGSSFKEKQMQLSKLTMLIQALRKLPESDFKEEAVFNLKSAQREIEEEERPSSSKLEKYFKGASKAFKGIELGRELLTQISQVYDSFNLNDFLTNISSIAD